MTATQTKPEEGIEAVKAGKNARLNNNSALCWFFIMFLTIFVGFFVWRQHCLESRISILEKQLSLSIQAQNVALHIDELRETVEKSKAHRRVVRQVIPDDSCVCPAGKNRKKHKAHTYIKYEIHANMEKLGKSTMHCKFYEFIELIVFYLCTAMTSLINKYKYLYHFIIEFKK